MAKKIEIIGHSLVITETNDNSILLDVPKEDVYYLITELINVNKIIIYDKSSSNKYSAKLLSFSISEALDVNNIAFTRENFINFARENLGFRSGGGDGEGSQSVSEYSDLTVGNSIGEISYVGNSTGNKWLSAIGGGNYYPKGWYRWNGTEWVSDRNAIVDKLSHWGEDADGNPIYKGNSIGGVDKVSNSLIIEDDMYVYNSFLRNNFWESSRWHKETENYEFATNNTTQTTQPLTLADLQTLNYS